MNVSKLWYQIEMKKSGISKTVRIKGPEYSRLPALPNYICNCRIHIIWNVKTAMLKSNCTNNLHWVHSTPWLLQCRELPQYNPEAINITPAF